ncbi:hypothetical protein Q4601_20700 [Shewanella sp. 1_MG-2023]|uniref:hypothetical protein n=1 Tax=unclassified Shewanella TaxID=196818 RepID=UPI0026E2A20D|nr:MULTISPECIES: hypothetical protein [unclassified Shewanella]MDO6613907.1 hypothetical protein [Shewanella sp. 7_MG-2023]MDO6773201.1 hypothetical protein [Shewanella sp. 2_MG-2023]MDO6796716.1 hypothetical protein [Shewanella sp. 1_MG-2023]
MNAVFQTDFERTEFTDEIHSLFGRILILTSRFDSACKALVRLPSVKVSVSLKGMITDDEFKELLNKNLSSFKNLNRAIQSLPEYKLGASQVLDQARDSRNELIHSSALGMDRNLDDFDNIDRFMQNLASLVRELIRGDIVVSCITSLSNKEDIPDYFLSKEYENSILKWVFQRFQT